MCRGYRLCGAEPSPPHALPVHSACPLPSSSIPGVLVLLCSGPHGAQRAVTTESAGAPRTSDLGEGERRVCVCVCERERERERERETESWSHSGLGPPGLSSSCLSVGLSLLRVTCPHL